MQMTQTFNSTHAGPPFAANGGHVAGVLAQRAGLVSGQVEFRAPVPLETAVEVTADASSASIQRAGTVLAAVSAATLLDTSNPGVDFETARIAGATVDATDHPFPYCYVCGPARDQSGLHMLPGSVEPGLVATVWEPTRQQAHGCGTVPISVVTAVLDCPSAFAFLGRGEAAVLASMTYSIKRLPRVGERLVVTGSTISDRGSKAWAATSIATETGATVARASNLWVRVDSHRLAAIEARTYEMAA